MTTEQENQVEQDRGPAPTARRRPYVRPELTEYGNVRDFTRGGGSKSKDLGTFFK